MSPDPEPTDDLLALTDELLSQTAELKRQWLELAQAAGVDPITPDREAEIDRVRPGRERVAPDPRRMVAVEMMLSGRRRDEVEAYLRNEFGDEAAEMVIADVYRGS